MIAWGIGIALFAIFAAELTTWLLWGEFGSFGFLDAVFVLFGLVQVSRGIHRIVTAKRPVK